jgi:hypothetical protein
MTDNSKPVAKRAGTRKPKTKPPRPDHDQIAELAYFIHLEEGDRDELTNWLRAERELTTA